MRRLICASILSTVLACSPAFGETEDARPALSSKVIVELTLDELFAELPEQAGSPPGKRIEAEILKRLNQSGSDTADLLMSWATSAIEAKNYALALDILDQIVLIKPDFAEGWNKRATVHFLMNDYASSLSDVRQTLALEPRHFGALAGLGMIFQSMDRNREAVRVYRRALDINPQLDRVKEALERLEKETADPAI
jgi:tetratricopeptide (TPR) repeat protein